ncbi:MAG: restriction endonuclease subunit S [Phycisphaerae bacterium]|nr:restriction endonuclease subunit S [Phycisphaerae bacterium]
MRATNSTIPEGWDFVALRRLLREVDSRVMDLSPADGDDLVVLSLTKRFGLIPQTERFRSRMATEDVGKYKVVRRGWIVYNPYVLWEGAIHALQRDRPGIVSPVYAVWERTEDDGGFLDFLLRTPALLACYEQLGAGAVNRRRSVKKDDFLDIEVAAPPLRDQRGIASILSLVRRVIENEEKAIAVTRALKESVAEHFFTHGLCNSEPVGSNHEAIPPHWSTAPLGRHTILAQYGLSIRGSETGRIPILRMNCQRDGMVVFRDLQYVDVDKVALNNFRLQDGDLLFNRTNSYELVGRTAVFHSIREAVFASYLVRLRLDTSVWIPDFINYYLNRPIVQTDLKKLASRGVSQANISASKLKEFSAPIAPLEEQREIVGSLTSLDQSIAGHETRLAILRDLFTSLLDKLMTGEIRVDKLNVDISEVASA